MQRRESYLYVGMDLHKKTHTAVGKKLLERKELETLVMKTKTAEFEKLVLKRVNYRIRL